MATHQPTAGHETVVTVSVVLGVGLAGRGAAIAVHFPFENVSMSPRWESVVTSYLPTATHHPGAAHDTSVKVA